MKSERAHPARGEDAGVERKSFVKKIEIPSTKGKLAAIVHYPKEKSDRLAVLCPGYLDTKDYDHLVRLAEDLCDRGYAVVRFDPTGTWESEGSLADYNTTQQLDDMKSVIDRMIKEGGYKNVLVGGHSRGGMTSILYAARDPRISAVLAIMPPPVLMGTVGAERMEKWKKDGFRTSTRDIPGKKERRGFHVPYSDVEDSRKYDLLGDVKKIKAPMVLVTGELDTTVPPEDVKRIFDKANEPKKMIVMEGIGHNYRNNPDDIKKVDEEVLRGLDEVIAAANLQK
ncbi:MAG: alpha/beta hydrolase [Candidatus Liptonbacteria bacterium]|nr:alpha/beta hydrolase [Candidatus Liptonbacteria bacterium]